MGPPKQNVVVGLVWSQLNLGCQCRPMCKIFFCYHSHAQYICMYVLYVHMMRGQLTFARDLRFRFSMLASNFFACYIVHN